MSSSRLPGKAFMDISGKSLIQRVIERTKCLKLIDHITLATSTEPEDDIIASYAKKHKIDVFRGSLNDVAGRAMEVCKHYKYDDFIRICGDRPFFDVELYDHLISIHTKNNSDLTTNIFPRNVPPGFTCEIIKVNTFSEILQLTFKPEDREHVTTYFYRNSSNFSITNVEFKKQYNLPELRLVIDDKDDLQRARWIAKNSKEKKCNYDSDKIISLAMEWDKQSEFFKNKNI